MEYILTGTEMAEADRFTSESIGIPSLVLMERAALSVADVITERFSGGSRISIVCGPGNNGADGAAAGRILLDRGYAVQFLMLFDRAPAPGTSMAVQLGILSQYGAAPAEMSAQALEDFRPDVIVDAMFGTGLARDMTGKAEEAVGIIDRMRGTKGVTVIGLDIPSGVSAQDGRILGCAPVCDMTVTFAFRKRGHCLFPGSAHCGEVILREIGITERSLTSRPGMYTLDRQDILASLPVRAQHGNKGTFGRILLAAGSYNMCGAAVLSAKAALRAGAGMVRIFTRDENRLSIQQMLPEALLTTYKEGDPDLADKLREAADWADTAAAGPGIGRSADAETIVRILLETASLQDTRLRGLVLDADALRILAKEEALGKLLQAHSDRTACILTPHLAEFADLAGCSVKEAAVDRDGRLMDLAAKYRCTVTGKDARTMIGSYTSPQICLITHGNSGMATAGSGDMLTGITAAMLACRETGRRDEDGGAAAARTAAWIHALAGDRAKKRLGEHAMLASDLCEETGTVLRLMEEELAKI